MPSPRSRQRSTTARENKPGPRVMAALRRMIASGEFSDGARIAEIPTAERLGVSRMPVRTALRALALEGLVVPLGTRGFAARTPSPAASLGAVEVRGVLEGLAARLAAQHADHTAIAAQLDAILDPCNAIFTALLRAEDVIERYSAINTAFHETLLLCCGNPAIGLALTQINRLPLAAPDAFAFNPDDTEQMIAVLDHAHNEHRALVAAIAMAEADLAETVMRRHAQVSLAFEHRLDTKQNLTLPTA